VGKFCYVAVCSAEQNASAPTGEGGRGHIMASARLQLVFFPKFILITIFSYEILFVSFVIQSQQRLCTTCCSAVCSSHALNRTISGCARELHRTEQHDMQRCRVADFGLRPSGMRKNQSSSLSLVTRRGQSMLSYWIYHWSWPLPRKYAGRVRVCFDPLKMSHSLIQNCCWITLQVSQWGWWL